MRSRFSQEVRELAVRLPLEYASEHPSRRSTIALIASKVGCSARTLSAWITRSDTDTRRQSRVTTDDQAPVNALEREVKALCRANEVCLGRRRISFRQCSITAGHDVGNHRFESRHASAQR